MESIITWVINFLKNILYEKNIYIYCMEQEVESIRDGL